MPAHLFHGVRGGASGSVFDGLAWLLRSAEGSTVRARDGEDGNGDGGQNGGGDQNGGGQNGGGGGGRHGGHDCNNNNRRDGHGCGHNGGFGGGGSGGDGNSGDNGPAFEPAPLLSSPLASSTPEPLVVQGVSPVSTPLPSPTGLSTTTDSTSPASQSVLPQNTLSHEKIKTVAIASGAIGGFFVLILIAGAIWLWMRRRKNRTAPSAEFLIYPPGVPFQRMGSSSSLSHNDNEPPPPFAPGLYPYPIREKEG